MARGGLLTRGAHESPAAPCSPPSSLGAAGSAPSASAAPDRSQSGR